MRLFFAYLPRFAIQKPSPVFPPHLPCANIKLFAGSGDVSCKDLRQATANRGNARNQLP
jgi:hypothetical protein